MRTPLLALLVLLGLAVACSATAEIGEDRTTAPTLAPSLETPSASNDTDRSEPASPQATTAPEPSEPDSEPSVVEPSTSGPAIGEPANNRIAVATAEGKIFLADPDGGNRLDLAAGDQEQGFQPVWSPDGRRIAWSERGAAGFSIVSTNADGSERRRAPTLFSGYFGYWNPTSTQLGFLGNAAPGTGLVLDSGDERTLDSVFDSDTFYYFSWSPDGTRWVVHSGSGMRIVGLDGSRTTINLPDARFRAPIWAPNGDLLLGIQTQEGGVIAKVDPQTQRFEELLESGEAANFVLDPTGRFLAVETLNASEVGEEEQGETVSFQPGSQPVSAQPTSNAELVIYDMETGETEQVLQERSGGFWWSRDGASLAVLVTDEADPTRFAQWLVWSQDGSFRTERFTVSPLYASSYVPFFDQFAQSVSPWAPDGRRFVYAGFDEDGEGGVFVQPAEAGAPAERIADEGAVAFWSPT